MNGGVCDAVSIPTHQRCTGRGAGCWDRGVPYNLPTLRLDLQKQQDAVDHELPGQRLLVRGLHGGRKHVGRQHLGLLGIRGARIRSALSA